MIIFSRRILVENAPDSYSRYFFYKRKVHFFVHLFNILNYGSSKHSKPQILAKTKRNKTDVQNLENTLRIPLSSPFTFFGTMRLFFEIFWIAPKGPLSFVSKFCNTMNVKKSQSIPFYIFRHCDSSKISF